MIRIPNYWVIPPRLTNGLGRVVLGRSPRAGMTSVVRSCEQAGLAADRDTVSRTAVPGLALPVILFVRNPVDRFKSAWNGIGTNFLDTTTYEAFVDNILGGGKYAQHLVDDMHWRPQRLIHTENGVFVPTRVFRFDRINEIWPRLFSFPLLREHASPTDTTSAYREEELRTAYSEDLASWNVAEIA